MLNTLMIYVNADIDISFKNDKKLNLMVRKCLNTLFRPSWTDADMKSTVWDLNASLNVYKNVF